MILIVDDHKLFAEGLQQLLANALPDHVVRLAYDAVEALLTLEEAGSELELVLLDLKMPRIDGIAFMKAAASRNVAAPIVVISAIEDPTEIEAALALGAAGFIPKNHCSTELLSAVRRIFAGEIYVPAEIRARLAALAKRRPETGGKYRRLGITDAQFRVLGYVAYGCSNREIAQLLHVTENTVKSHLRALYRIFGVGKRTALVRSAERTGLIPAANSTAER